MLSYSHRTKAIFISGVIVLAGFLVCFNLKTGYFVMPQPISLIGMILGALIIFYAVRKSPAKHVSEIILAAGRNDVRYLRSLINSQETPPGTLFIALCDAVKNGADKAVEILLEKGADPNYGGYSRCLDYALSRYEKRADKVSGRAIDIIDWLLKSGADPDLPVNSINKSSTLIEKMKALGLSDRLNMNRKPDSHERIPDITD